MRLKKQKQPQESLVMKVVNVGGTAVMLNLMFLLACLPVVTFGPALSGLYSGVRYMIRGDGAARGFWEGFKTHFVRMMITGVIFIAIIGYFVWIIGVAYYDMWAVHGQIRELITQGICGMIPMMVLAALIPLNIYIPYGATDWLKNGVNLIFKAPLQVLLSACLLAVPIVCVFWIPDIAILSIVCLVGFWFAMSAFVSTLVLKDPLVDMLLTYREEHPEEEEEEEEETEETEEASDEA